MDLKERFRGLLEKLRIDPETLPKGTMALLESSRYSSLCADARRWGSRAENRLALAYEIESEHRRGVGVLLRNLYDDHRKSHCDAIPEENTSPPYFHNLSPSLPACWKTGIAVLCEGPKDARCLWSLGIPAIAYLGRSPTRAHLNCLSRYSSAIFWIPDSDVLNPRDPQASEVRDRVGNNCRSLGIQLRTVSLPVGCKDPALLAKEERWIETIRGCYRNFVRTVGVKDP